MLTTKIKILIASLLILLAAGLFGYGAFYHSSHIQPAQKDDCTKLAELEAALIKAASKSRKQNDLSILKLKYTGNSPKTHST